jgi:hypothetical protein
LLKRKGCPAEGEKRRFSMTSGLRHSFNGVFWVPQRCGGQKMAFFRCRRPAPTKKRRFSTASGRQRPFNGVFPVPQACGGRKTAFLGGVRPAALV